MSYRRYMEIIALITLASLATAITLIGLRIGAGLAVCIAIPLWIGSVLAAVNGTTGRLWVALVMLLALSLLDLALVRRAGLRNSRRRFSFDY